MGQGQEEAARKYMTLSITKGHWLLLQNCHLSLTFCEEIMQTIIDTEEVDTQTHKHKSHWGNRMRANLRSRNSSSYPPPPRRSTPTSASG